MWAGWHSVALLSRCHLLQVSQYRHCITDPHVILWLLTPNKTLNMSFHSLRRKISWLIKCPDESHQLLYLIFFMCYAAYLLPASIHHSLYFHPHVHPFNWPHNQQKNNLRSPVPARCCWLFANSASLHKKEKTRCKTCTIYTVLSFWMTCLRCYKSLFNQEERCVFLTLLISVVIAFFELLMWCSSMLSEISTAM